MFWKQVRIVAPRIFTSWRGNYGSNSCQHCKRNSNFYWSWLGLICNIEEMDQVTESTKVDRDQFKLLRENNLKSKIWWKEKLLLQDSNPWPPEGRDRSIFTSCPLHGGHTPQTQDYLAISGQQQVFPTFRVSYLWRPEWVTEYVLRL